MRISDWSSDVCSSDLGRGFVAGPADAAELRGPLVLASPRRQSAVAVARDLADAAQRAGGVRRVDADHAGGAHPRDRSGGEHAHAVGQGAADPARAARSEEHTSELQSLMRISYAVFCLKKQTHK